MLDIKFIRENPEVVKAGAQKKQMDPSVVDQLLLIDEKRRDLITRIEELRSRRNKITKENRDEGLAVKEGLKKLEPELEGAETEFKRLLLSVPNFPADDVPEGAGEADNVVVKKVG